MVHMAHTKETWDVCVYTDASQNHWGAIFTHLAPEYLSKPREEQNHFPLEFISVSFRGSMLGVGNYWEKPMQWWKRVKDWNIYCWEKKDIHIFRDRRNLQSIFDPGSIDITMARYRADMLQRWAMVLKMFRYTLEHVAGTENVWGDLLLRRGCRDKEGVKREKRNVV